MSYIEETPDRADVLEALMEEAERGQTEIVTSTVSVAEVAYHEREKRGWTLEPEIEERIAALFEPPSPVKLVEFHRLIGEAARELIRGGLPNRWSLKSIDAIHLATAQYMKASQMFTYDGKLHRYNEMIGMPVTEPIVEQRTLFMPETPRQLSSGDTDAES